MRRFLSMALTIFLAALLPAKHAQKTHAARRICARQFQSPCLASTESPSTSVMRPDGLPKQGGVAQSTHHHPNDLARGLAAPVPFGNGRMSNCP